MASFSMVVMPTATDHLRRALYCIMAIMELGRTHQNSLRLFAMLATLLVLALVSCGEASVKATVISVDALELTRELHKCDGAVTAWNVTGFFENVDVHLISIGGDASCADVIITAMRKTPGETSNVLTPESIRHECAYHSARFEVLKLNMYFYLMCLTDDPGWDGSTTHCDWILQDKEDLPTDDAAVFWRKMVMTPHILDHILHTVTLPRLKNAIETVNNSYATKRLSQQAERLRLPYGRTNKGTVGMFIDNIIDIFVGVNAKMAMCMATTGPDNTNFCSAFSESSVGSGYVLGTELSTRVFVNDLNCLAGTGGDAEFCWCMPDVGTRTGFFEMWSEMPERW